MAPLSDFGQTAGLRLSTLWSPAYLVTSVGGVSRATIRWYIAKQISPSEKGKP
jgi:REP element-mobilizing transposase RayT